MKVVRRDKAFKEKIDVQRSIDMAIDRLQLRLANYAASPTFEIGKVFGDDVLIHDIINKYYYVFKCKVNQMQIRLLYTIKDGKLIIVSHWYKYRTDNGYIDYFKKAVCQYQGG